MPTDLNLPQARERARGRRTTIAFLADYMTHFIGAYEAQFRNILAAKCQTRDINLLLVYGGAFGHPSPISVGQNSIFSLVHPDSVDGLILLSTNLASYAGAGKVQDFVARLDGLACCSIGLALEGVPSVVIDNDASMAAVVEHLVTVHGRRRIAFLGGTPDNPEGLARHAAYCRTLRRHGLFADPALFAHGYFWGRKALDGLNEILARNVPFDALVCANDSMAHVVVAALNRRGVRVPADVLVTGFDDVAGSKLVNPPLTTAAQPFEAMAERALHILLEQLAGREVPLVSNMKAELVVRQSCGCGRRAARSKSQQALALEEQAVQHLRQAEGRIQSRLQCEIGSVTGCETDGAARLLRALEAELSGKAGTFLECVELIADAASQSLEQLLNLQRALSELRDELRSFSCTNLEDLWHEARDRVDLAIVRGQTQHRTQVDDLYLRLLESSEEVSRALTRDAFRISLSKILPMMKIRSGAISRYVEGDETQLELLAGMLDSTLREDTLTRFPARQLMPSDTYADGRRHTSLVLPLVLETKRMGVAVFEYSGDAIGQVMVRTQISAALSSIHLHQEIVEKTTQHERSLQERTATGKRLEALSVLAGGVAHDLNNAIGPLVALPDVMLGDLEAALAGGDPRELRRDLETVKSAALRATQTIKDLLTLGRQGRTTKEALDLVQVVTTCASSDLLRVVRSVSPQIQLRVEVPSGPLIVHGSEAHIARAITNLIHNAAEAISEVGGKGEVLLEVHVTHLSAPVHGFESIEPGEYVVITVTDNGRGMPTQDLNRVFEPFFSRKRTREQSGSGLGLAIVHGVVKEHDGFVDLASTPDAGTRFSLYFPRAEAEIKVSTRSTVAPERGQARILIVDDEPTQLRTGRRVLRRFGYEVDTLESGSLAHDHFMRAARGQARPYDLVILDMNLNEARDGLELFDEIRRLFPEQRAIVVSGHAPTERAEAAFRKGLAWLAKPYTADALLYAVQDALSERPSQSMRISSRRPPVDA